MAAIPPLRLCGITEVDRSQDKRRLESLLGHQTMPSSESQVSFGRCTEGTPFLSCCSPSQIHGLSRPGLQPPCRLESLTRGPPIRLAGRGTTYLTTEAFSGPGITGRATPQPLRRLTWTHRNSGRCLPAVPWGLNLGPLHSILLFQRPRSAPDTALLNSQDMYRVHPPQQDLEGLSQAGASLPWAASPSGPYSCCSLCLARPPPSILSLSNFCSTFSL